MYPYSSIDTTAAWKKLRFILSVRFDFYMTDSLLVAALEAIKQAFAQKMISSLAIKIYLSNI